MQYLEFVADQKQDVYLINAMGGALRNIGEEYRVWARKFSAQGNTTHWLMSAKFDEDISNLGDRHEMRRLKLHISSPTVHWIFGDFVANVNWGSDGEKPIVFLIKNKSIAESHREHFDYLWKHGSVPFKRRIRS